MASSDSNSRTRKGTPFLSGSQTRDVDTAQHFLADHAGAVVVAFDHNAMDPRVVIYTTTPEGVLFPGDYYLWPLLHRTSERLRQEIAEWSRTEGGSLWGMDRRRLGKWQRRIPQLTTLIRIRKAAIQAICGWDLTGGRPSSLKVIDTSQDLTGLTIDEAANVAGSGPRQAV